MDEETVLMARLHFGDGAALAELYARLGPHVYALCFELLQSREDAEEVLQDTFARLSSGPHLYRPELGSPRAYVYTVARNTALSRLRARKARPTSLDPALVPAERLAAHTQDLDVRSSVHTAMETLPRSDQRLLLDAFFQGLTHPEIATARSMPLGTVKTRLRRALLAMRRRLEDA
ncbi:RNA polymerase [Deinococcus ruber]|uniref:RNA polymerase n=2 Tax=Deinococcus ruber TaxID=1848197 RepID=A0A918C691_9DEIO|nr:RNA polymerase [Deinococcus ruber]